MRRWRGVVCTSAEGFTEAPEVYTAAAGILRMADACIWMRGFICIKIKKKGAPFVRPFSLSV